MDKLIEQAVRARAKNNCEYCRLPQSARRLRFQIDHVIAQQHGGGTELDNLALSCGRCNRFKGPNIAGIDPIAEFPPLRRVLML
jgi:5-methylcytosine-specific restriction endonuclease McrA